MRLLKKSTVVREFQRRGWHWDAVSETLTSQDINAGSCGCQSPSIGKLRMMGLGCQV